jgi:Leucine-rich repeat (LRR) protein
MNRLLSAIIVLGIVITACLLVRWDTLAWELNEIFCPQCSMTENTSGVFLSFLTTVSDPTPFPETEGWIPGETSVSRLSKEEQNRLLGVPAEVVTWEEEQVQLKAETLTSKTFTNPTEIDWRNYQGQDWTTPIRNQGGCGSCIAFSTVATIESRIEVAAQDPDLNPNLSEDHLFFCGCGRCCGSGWMPAQALNFATNVGIVDEECAPYYPTNHYCSRCDDWENRATKIQRWETASSIDEIKYTIATSGPVLALVGVYRDFFWYTGGIYRHTWGDYAGFHGVALVGYDDVDRYWIGKNSWGTSWGESGWFRVAYGEVSIDNFVYIPIVNDPDPSEICEDVIEIPKEECVALASVYIYSHGDEWVENQGWMNTNYPCDWYGVECAGGHVKSLNLPNNGLRNALSPVIADLTELEILNLSGNELSGNLLPILGELNNLKWLDLSDNQFYGSIPLEFGNLNSLQTLALSENGLNGSIPPTLGNLALLEELCLDNNGFSGAIPTEFGNLVSLTTMQLHNNYLGNEIPSSLGQLVILEELTLSNNVLRREIPSTFANLIDLEQGRLDLGYNALTAIDPSLKLFLDEKDPDWWETQTIPPTDLWGSAMTREGVLLFWTPISYTGDKGYYLIWISGNGHEEVRETNDKTNSSLLITGLHPGSTYTFKINTFTFQHGAQKSTIISDYSEEVEIQVPEDDPYHLFIPLVVRQ